MSADDAKYGINPVSDFKAATSGLCFTQHITHPKLHMHISDLSIHSYDGYADKYHSVPDIPVFIGG